MAKAKSSVFNISGTIQGMTHVDSATYGEHVRAPRGTYKPAIVNNKFKEISHQLISANRPAKLIKDALDPYRKDFNGGLLWQRLVSVFRKQFKATGTFNFSGLENFEINKDYPLSRLINFQTAMTYNAIKSQVVINLDILAHPVFRKAKLVDGYRLSLIAVYPDLKQNTAKTFFIQSPVISLADQVKPVSFTIPQEQSTEKIVLCIKLEGCECDEAVSRLAVKGMKIVGAIHNE